MALAVSLAALTSCGGSADDVEVRYDGSYVSCKGATLTGPDGSVMQPDPDHEACRQP